MKLNKTSTKASSQDVMAFLQKHGEALLPPEGAWVVFYGMHRLRSSPVPKELADVGVKHLDIYWGYNEHCPWSCTQETLRMEPEEAVEYILDSHMIRHDQLTLVDLHTPNSKQVCAWQGELRMLKNVTLDEMLAEGYLEVMPMTKETSRPVWDETTRDMVGSLMLDGLSYAQAQKELITAGEEFEVDNPLPNHFYRAAGAFKATFGQED